MKRCFLGDASPVQSKKADFHIFACRNTPEPWRRRSLEASVTLPSFRSANGANTRPCGMEWLPLLTIVIFDDRLQRYYPYMSPISAKKSNIFACARKIFRFVKKFT